MATPEERSAAASEQMSVAMANLVTTLTAQQAAADKKARDEEKREAALKETTDMMVEALRENTKFDEDKAKEEKKKVVERKLLGQSEEQYEATLAQRKVAEDAEKELNDMKGILGDSAESNEKYQKVKAKFDKEEAKSKKLEGRRNLFSRFKETKGEAGTGAAVKEFGGTVLKGIGKTFKKIGGFLGQFSKIFSILVIPALVLLVNSPAWGMLKKGIENLIDYLSSDDNFLFGKNGIIKLLVDKFGGLNLAIAGVLGVLTLKFLGFSGLKAAFLGLKFVVTKALIPIVIAIKGAFIAVLGTLTTFFGIAAAPLIAIVAAIAAVGYALFDTFKEVRKKFLEGASVGELIQTAIVNFVGAFYKILDFAKNLLADVLEFFGFENIAKKFREFSFEKIVEDGLNKVFDFFKGIFDFDFQGMFQNMLASVLPKPNSFVGEFVPASVYALAGIDKKTGEKLEDPAAREKRLADEKKQEEARELAQRKKTSKIRKLEDQIISVERIKAQRRRVAKFQRDVDTDRSKAMFFAETPEDQAADREKLLKAKEQLELMEETQAALEGEIAKAKAAPININAPTVNTVNEAPKTENNVTNSSSLKGFGTVGALSAGMGTMASGIGE